MSVECIQPWLAHRPRRGATVVDTIVMHATCNEDLQQKLSELKEKGFSYHYIIDRAGLPHKCVPYSAVAFHAGNSYGPHELARGISKEQDANHNFVDMTSVNEYSIGLCLVNTNEEGDLYSQEQLDACVWLIKELKGSLPALKYITGHMTVSPGRVSDPAGLDIARIAKKTGLEVWAMN